MSATDDEQALIHALCYPDTTKPEFEQYATRRRQRALLARIAPQNLAVLYLLIKALFVATDAETAALRALIDNHPPSPIRIEALRALAEDILQRHPGALPPEAI